MKLGLFISVVASCYHKSEFLQRILLLPLSRRILHSLLATYTTSCINWQHHNYKNVYWNEIFSCILTKSFDVFSTFWNNQTEQQKAKTYCIPQPLSNSQQCLQLSELLQKGRIYSKNAVYSSYKEIFKQEQLVVARFRMMLVQCSI